MSAPRNAPHALVLLCSAQVYGYAFVYSTHPLVSR